MSVSFRQSLRVFLGRTLAVGRTTFPVGLQIEGIEVTQGIQHYQAARHLKGAFTDNSLRVVAGKPAWVRVYLRSGWFPSISNVTGVLDLERRTWGVWSKVGSFAAQPPSSVTAWSDPDYRDERGNANRTLNFVIPSEFMCGHLRLKVEVTAPDGHIAVSSMSVDASLKQTLRVRAITVGYNGLDTAGNTVNLPAPTLAELQSAAVWAVQVFPVSSIPELSIAGTFTHGSSVAQVKTGCGDSSNWGGLVDAYLQARANDGDKPGVIYLGLVAAGTPGANSAGCSSIGPDWVFAGAGEDAAFAGLDGSFELTAETTIAHELGHYLGIQHAPGLTPDPNPDYPDYSPTLPTDVYDSGSIGEYGLDTNTGSVYSPAKFADFMSYQPRRWISPYTWKRLIFHPLLSPEPACVDPFPWEQKYYAEVPKRDPDPTHSVINLVGVVNPSGRLRITSVTRGSTSRAPRGALTPFVAELVDEEESPISSATLRYSDSVGQRSCSDHRQDGEVVVQAQLADVGPGAALRVERDGTEIWRRDAPSGPPEIVEFTAVVTDEGHLEARWSVRGHSATELHYWLRWRRRDGDEWHGLAVGLHGNRVRLGTVGLDPGAALLLLVAHDGYHSTQSDPVEIVIPAPPLAGLILSPRAGQEMYAGRTLRLAGAALGRPLPRLDPDVYRWLVDGREVGRGPEVFIETPPPGDHHCALILQVGGDRAVEETRFRTHAAPP